MLGCIGFCGAKRSMLFFYSQVQQIEELLILPIGISFYSLQALGYLVDIYNGKEKPEHNFLKVALYLFFFPKFIFDPLEKAISFLTR